MNINIYNRSLKGAIVISLFIIGFLIALLVTIITFRNTQLLEFILIPANITYWGLWCLWILCFFFSKQLAGKFLHLTSLTPALILVILSTIQFSLFFSLIDSFINYREEVAVGFLAVYGILNASLYFKIKENQKLHYLFGSFLSVPIYLLVFILTGFFSF